MAEGLLEGGGGGEGTGGGRGYLYVLLYLEKCNKNKSKAYSTILFIRGISNDHDKTIIILT